MIWGSSGTHDNRRRHVRHQERVPIRIHLSQVSAFECSTIDISGGGVCVVCEDPLSVGQRIVVEFLYEAKGHLRQLCLNSRVVYQRAKKSGFVHGIQFLGHTRIITPGVEPSMRGGLQALDEAPTWPQQREDSAPGAEGTPVLKGPQGVSATPEDDRGSWRSWLERCRDWLGL